MSVHFPALIAVLLLSAAHLSPFFSYISKQAGRYLVTLAVVASFLCTVAVLARVMDSGEVIHYWMGNWAPPYGIEYVIDHLNAFMAVVVMFVAVTCVFYSKPFIADKDWLQVGGYYALFALLTAGLVGMVITGDVFNLYVFLEISSLAGYGLIAMGGKRSVLASFRYLLLGTIGATFYLLGVGYLYGITGTLNMADLAVRVVPLMDSPAVLLAVALFIGGFGIKMALFPFHGWQPDAYTYAHPAASPMIAGVMGKVPIYALMRYFLYVFGLNNELIVQALDFVSILACIAIILGSVMAIAQTDLRRMLAYSSVAQIGYILLGLAIGNVYGIIGALLHLVSHAVAKASLFMAAGNIRYRYGIVDIREMGQLYRKMPVTALVIVIAALSMIGIPPTGGFFSKWYLALGAIEQGKMIFVAVLIISSLLNAIYFFRLIENIFIKKDEHLPEVNKPKGMFEVPLQMLLPILVLGLSIILLGVFNEPLLTNVLQFALPEVVLP